MQLARIHLWGELVGALAEDSATQTSTFEYAPEWIKKGIEISPIHMPLTLKKFQLQRDSRSIFRGLPPVFADALADGFSKEITDKWLADSGKLPDINSSLAYLLLLGQQGRGAIEFLTPESASKRTPKNDNALSLVTLEELSASVGHLALGNAISPADREQLAKATFTLSGSQPKMSVARLKETGQLFTGLATCSDEYEHYIIKFGGIDGSAAAPFNAIEYAYNSMAQACGINTSHCELLHDSDHTHLMVERFDRNATFKLHTQSFSALTHTEPFTSHLGYEDVFALMRQLRLDKLQALEMLRRMVFNVIACNHNDHGKNISFVMNKEGAWSLAPAYGLTYSNGLGTLGRHKLHINHKTEQFTREDLLAVVPSLRSEADQIISEISERVSVWPLFARQAEISREQMSRIQRDHLLDL